ncbi:hypothetical protein VRU48_12280 [Pedobacter sp. KR3-3]|uniref:Peptidase S74 domain-containing protein n=1 Tax=Pedobacter albus TaxID=3113905 RepID=A0ABU7I929_9SPHI|nr:hypothetical protein [Pedobacter sp. KR3-3]MEE1945889.1 hypothetical protein [Pedobacter sp. KR3-3]
MKKYIITALVFLSAKTLMAQTNILAVQDTRATATVPSSYAQSVESHFKSGAILGLPNTYYTVLGLRGWADDSGGKAHELTFSDEGNMYIRSGYTGTGWGSWRSLLVSNDNGNFGIGMTTPSEKLTVNGNINIFDPTGGAYLGFGTANNNEYNTIGSMYASAGLVLAHGLKPHSASEQLVYSHGSMARSAIVLGRGFSEGGIKFYTKSASSETIGAIFSGEPTMQITDNGNVGIGTTTPNEKLSVNGKIRAKEIKVETANWPDYVFEEDYKVGTLQALESYIKANKHLPEIPSAKEVEANGVELGEMNKLLLKKVEELTLLLIDQNKKNEKQEQAIDELRKEIEKVKNKK